jgi:hypothetical protein
VTPTRSSAKQSSAAESGSKQATNESKQAITFDAGGIEHTTAPWHGTLRKGKKKRPVGLIPHVPQKVPEERLELVLVIAENLFPGKYGLTDLKPMERERWVALGCSILLGNPDLSAQVEALAEVLRPGIQAEIEDTLLKREYFFQREEERSKAEAEEREERKARADELHAAALAHQERATEIGNEHSELHKKITEQHRAQEKIREANGDKLEGILMVMLVIAFTLAVVLIIAAAVATQINDKSSSLSGLAIAAGGSGGTGLVSVVMLMLHRTRRVRMELKPDPKLAPLASSPLPAGEAPTEASA